MPTIDKNKHGLSRKIPLRIKRQIRQECGFGCVICGLAIAQYEHIDPPFAEAREHDPSKIALLCGACHDKVTRRIWSKQKVIEARENPCTFRKGYAREAFDIRGPITLYLGSNEYQNVSCIIRTSSGQTWLEIAPPNAPEEPYRLSAQFFDQRGEVVLTIEENDWFCPITVWDVEVHANVLTVRNSDRDIALQLEAMPRDGIRLHKLNMVHRDFSVTISQQRMTLRQNGSTIELDACEFKNSNTVFLIGGV